MRDFQETLQWYRANKNSTAWKGLCLKLCRTARGIPAVYPSAIAAQHATPMSHRFTDLSKLKRGMVAYFDDPNDSNKYGHITTIAGRAKDGELLHWTNDAAGPGRVSVVRHSFFRQYWGDSFQFASDVLNGYELDIPPKKGAKKPLTTGKGPNIEAAINRLTKAIAYHRSKNNTQLVKALERDRAALKETYKKFGGK